MEKNLRGIDEINRIVDDIRSAFIQIRGDILTNAVMNNPLPHDAANSMLLMIPVKIEALQAEINAVGRITAKLRDQKRQEELSQ